MSFDSDFNKGLVLKKFWQRAVFYLVLSIFLSLVIYWLLSLYTPEMLSEASSSLGKRRSIVKSALSLMSPESWGWFCLIFMVVSCFGGDWHYHRFKDLPDEK